MAEIPGARTQLDAAGAWLRAPATSRRRTRRSSRFGSRLCPVCQRRGELAPSALTEMERKHYPEPRNQSPR